MLKFFPPPYHKNLSTHIYANTWTSTTAYPFAMISGGAGSLSNGSIIVCGGDISFSSGVGTANCYRFDPGLLTWTSIASLAQTYYYCAATGMGNNSIFFVAGSNSKGDGTTSVYRYDASLNQFSNLAPYPIGIVFPTVVTLTNGSIISWGGGNNSGDVVANAYIFNPGANSWATIANYPFAASQHGGALLPNGSVLSVCGDTSSSGYVSSPNCYIYSLTTSAWIQVNSYPIATSFNPCVALANGSILSIAGSLNATSDTTNCYTYSNNIWYSASSLPVALDSGLAAVLGNGSVIYIGGETLSNVVSTCYIYN